MRTSFQSRISSSQFSLPFIGILAVISWFILSSKDIRIQNLSDLGLWDIMPDFLQNGAIGLIIGLVFSTAIVFTMVDMSNTLVLLRTNSRIISCILVFLLAMTLSIHHFQATHIVMLTSILSLYCTFLAYQYKSAPLVFGSHFFLSISSLFCPKLLALQIVLWGIHAFLNAFSPKSLTASILAAITPYWIFFGLSVFFGQSDYFIQFITNLIEFHKPDYSTLKESQVLIGGFTIFLFVQGVVNFILTNDKTDDVKQRKIYNMIIIHGIAILMLLVLLPHCFNVFIGLFFINTSIVFGRSWTITENKFTRYFITIMTIIAILIVAISFNM